MTTPTMPDADEPLTVIEPTSLAERLKLWLVSGLGYWAIRIIGSTLRWEVEGWEHHRSVETAGKGIIYAFWHGRIFMATFFFRNRGIVVMTSQNKDGEYIARVIHRFGYAAARGSSSRGGVRALLQLIRELRDKKDIAFTIDGPRGPRYVAKPGAIWLASKSGNAVLPFHISPRNAWVFQSWDRFHVPKPFSRVFVVVGAPIFVKGEATAEELEEKQQELQRALEDLLERGDARWHTASGTWPDR